MPQVDASGEIPCHLLVLTTIVTFTREGQPRNYPKKIENLFVVVPRELSKPGFIVSVPRLTPSTSSPTADVSDGRY